MVATSGSAEAARFRDAAFVGAAFAVPLARCDFTGAVLADDAGFEGTFPVFAGAVLAGARFADAGFADGVFADAGFADAGFADAVFAGAGFANDAGFTDDTGFDDTFAGFATGFEVATGLAPAFFEAAGLDAGFTFDLVFAIVPAADGVIALR